MTSKKPRITGTNETATQSGQTQKKSRGFMGYVNNGMGVLGRTTLNAANFVHRGPRRAYQKVRGKAKRTPLWRTQTKTRDKALGWLMSAGLAISGVNSLVDGGEPTQIEQIEEARERSKRQVNDQVINALERAEELSQPLSADEDGGVSSPKGDIIKPQGDLHEKGPQDTLDDFNE
jgi:hypothetical protein